MSTNEPEVPEPALIAAVMVTYHPGVEVQARLHDLQDQVAQVVVVDNGSNDESRKILAKAASAEGVELLENHENRGVAAALNQGIRWAKDAGFQWILLLDQDTRLAPHMVEHLIEVYDAYPHKPELAMIGSGWRWEHHSASDGPLDLPDAPSWAEDTETSIITSGTFLPVRTFDRLGPFREDLFIDHVDTEYALRVHASDMRLIRTEAPLMTHGYGDPETRRMVWRDVTTYNHPPIRWYYRVRNAIHISREYGDAYPDWMRRIASVHLRNFAKMLLFEDERPSKVRHALEGAWDGLRGVRGPREDGSAPAQTEPRGPPSLEPSTTGAVDDVNGVRDP